MSPHVRADGSTDPGETMLARLAPVPECARV